MRLQLGLVLFVVVAGALVAQSEPDSTALKLDETRQRELTADRSHDHYVFMTAGQYARIEIAQRTVNVSVTVFNPAGKELFALDNNPIGDIEEVEWIAADSGKYGVRVAASEAHAPVGRYEIKLAVVSPATDRHRTRIAAARELALGSAANRQATREAMLQASGP